jgi:glycine/serine hydroxymethyltransferase
MSSLSQTTDVTFLRQFYPGIAYFVNEEYKCQVEGIELIVSGNVVVSEVMNVMVSSATNEYAEGHPDPCSTADVADIFSLHCTPICATLHSVSPLTPSQPRTIFFEIHTVNKNIILFYRLSPFEMLVLCFGNPVTTTHCMKKDEVTTFYLCYQPHLAIFE